MAEDATAQLQAEAESIATAGGIDVAAEIAEMQATAEETSSAALTSEEAAAATEDNQAQLTELTTPTETAEEAVTKVAEPTDLEAATTAANEVTAGMRAVVDSSTAQLDAAASTLDAQHQESIALIKETMNRRIEQMEQLNEAVLGAQTKIGIRAGRQRYAAEIQTSILAAEEAAGIQRIVDLETQKRQLILEAEQANSSKQWELLDKKMAAISDLEATQIAAINQQLSLAMEQERLALSKAADVREEARFMRGEEEATIDSITSTVFNSLTGDEATDVATIQSLADQYNIDANALVSSVRDYELAFEQNTLAAAAQYQAISANIPYGQSWTDPNSGMTFYSTQNAEEMDVTQTVGNTEYQVRYKMVDGEIAEQWRIELGPKWKSVGTGSDVTDVSESDAMDQIINDVRNKANSEGWSEEEIAAEIEFQAGIFEETYGVPMDTVIFNASTKIGKMLMSDEEIEEGGAEGVTFGTAIGEYLSSGEFFRPGGVGIGGVLGAVGGFGADVIEGGTGLQLGN